MVNVPIVEATGEDETTFTLGLTWAEIDELTDAGAVLYHKCTADTERTFGAVGKMAFIAGVEFNDPDYEVSFSTFDGNDLTFTVETENGYPYFIDGGK